MEAQTTGEVEVSQEPVPEKTNGRIKWRALAESQQLELMVLRREVKDLKHENEALQKGWLKPREQAHLEALSYFYRQMVNLQVDKAARARIDKECEDVVRIIKERDL